MINEHFSTVVKSLKQVLRTEENSTEKELVLIKKCLLNEASYRLLEKHKYDRLVGFKLWRHAVKKIFLSKEEYKIIPVTASSRSAIYAGSYKFYDLLLNYTNKQTVEQPKLFIAKDFLIYGLNFLQRLQLIIQLTVFSIPIIFKCINRSNRALWALLIFEVIENACLLDILIKNNIEKVYDFIPYEVDSNFMYWILKKQGIQVTKLPSPVPLFLHNNKLLADTLVLTSQYQFDELEAFRNKSIFIKNVEKWIPEFAFEYIDYYKNNNFSDNESRKYVIGYYSHGSWIRGKSGHAKISINIDEDELEILKYLKIFLNKYPQYRLIIYPHPKEKNPEIINKTKAFYKDQLGETNYSIHTEPGRTLLTFNQIDIAVCAFSAIIYDRLFAGFKTLIGLPCTHLFPMSGSNLNTICFKNYEQLEEKILQNTDIKKEQFFIQNNLGGYRYTDYPYFSDRRS